MSKRAPRQDAPKADTSSEGMKSMVEYPRIYVDRSVLFSNKQLRNALNNARTAAVMATLMRNAKSQHNS